MDNETRETIMKREEQILNGFAEMMKGFWNNQDLEVPNLETPCKCEKKLAEWLDNKEGQNENKTSI